MCLARLEKAGSDLCVNLQSPCEGECNAHHISTASHTLSHALTITNRHVQTTASLTTRDHSGAAYSSSLFEVLPHPLDNHTLR